MKPCPINDIASVTHETLNIHIKTKNTLKKVLHGTIFFTLVTRPFRYCIYIVQRTHLLSIATHIHTTNTLLWKKRHLVAQTQRTQLLTTEDVSSSKKHNTKYIALFHLQGFILHMALHAVSIAESLHGIQFTECLTIKYFIELASNGHTTVVPIWLNKQGGHVLEHCKTKIKYVYIYTFPVTTSAEVVPMYDGLITARLHFAQSQ